MRPIVRAEGLSEYLALWFNLGPVVVPEVMFGMGMTRVLMAGVTLGLFEELAGGSATAEEIAARRRLDAAGVRCVLDCLCALGHVKRRQKHYTISGRDRRWLDPNSPTYVGGFMEFNADQWEWWSHLEEVVRSGKGFELHDLEPEDPRWRRYITAMFQLARLSAPWVVRGLRLPTNPRHLLDLGGGHGWYAAELCRRHPTLRATVLDLPGSVRIGREIIAAKGMSEQVEHVEGDFLTDDLGGPYDAVLCFQIIHHLSPEQNVDLFRRVHASLAPGGVFVVLDYFLPPPRRKPDASAFLGLHFYLTSSATTYRVEEFSGWLQTAGFQPPRRVSTRLPVITVFEARQA